MQRQIFLFSPVMFTFRVGDMNIFYMLLNESLPKRSANIRCKCVFDAHSSVCHSSIKYFKRIICVENVYGSQLKMDQFVIRKRKQHEIDEGDSSQGDTSEGARSVENVLVTNTQQLPKKVDREKPKEYVRKFRVEWEEQFLVSEYKEKAVCLICRHDFNEFRKFTVKRHFTTNHSTFDTKYPASSKKRTDEISRLKDELLNEQKVVKQFLSSNELVTRASYEIAFEIAKHGKPYLDGELHKRLLQSTIETLCENWDEKRKRSLIEDVKKLPLSHQTVSRRVGEIGAELEANLKCDLEQCEAFSIALDETTDITDEAQLLFWVRYVIDERSEENILALVSLPERTTASDIFTAFKSIIIRFNLDLKKLSAICTDGAPAMLGVHNGFTALVKKHAAKHFDNHRVISYHCIIHQENLCAKALQRSSDVVETVTQVCVVAIYVFICLHNFFSFYSFIRNALF